MNRFKNRPTPHGNVVLHFHRNAVQDLVPFAVGYHMAARTLARHFRAAAGYADYEGYPIFFLYRHALELYLKALIYRGAAVAGLLSSPIQEVALFKSHGLKRLLPPVRAIFARLNWSLDGTPWKSLEALERLVEEVEELDPDSFLFRYPVNPEGQAPVDRPFTVDILLLANELDPLLELLDGACTGLNEHYQTLCEARAELEDYLRNLEA